MMPGATEPVNRSAGAGLEAERQLAAAAERHREVLASMKELGRSEAAQHVAVKAVGRAVHLVTFALRRKPVFPSSAS
jgi:UDP-N-acetylmuramyl pentapeptide synthase